VPWLVGGSADLAPSTKTRLSFEGAGDLSAATPGGRNLHYGIREHAMAAVLNGMVLSGLRAYGATFLVFCDYLRPALRLSALMGAPVVHVFTHDSIGVGEDGPTHQPIEQLAAMRAMIGLATIRPCDANETAEAWRVALERVDGPTALVLTRQALPTLDRAECASAAGLRRGGYVLLDAPAPRVILVASGSEVALCVAAKRELDAQGLPTRVVSMPSFELFEAQDAAYKEAVLPAAVRARVAVEAGVRLGWERHIGERGAFVGMSSYGASAPAGALMKHYGLTVENVVAQARRVAQA
jgi:transketolase